MCGDFVNNFHKDNKLEIQRLHNIECIQHMQYTMEIIYVWHGKFEVTLNTTIYELNCGDIIFIMPYQLHTIKTIGTSDAIILDFPSDYVSSFYNIVKNKEFSSPTFKISKEVIRYADNNLTYDIDIVQSKAVLYMLCNEFLKNIQFYQSKYSPNSTVINGLMFMEQNSDENISLNDVALAVGVHPVHLSHSFTQKLGISFTSCLNRFRLTNVLKEIELSENTFSEIAYNTGFGSIRNFNRIFRAWMGITPKQYRENLKYNTNISAVKKDVQKSDNH